ncbi:MAG: DUF3899 domain-containing protein [Candidatus Izemoplasma sp.]
MIKRFLIMITVTSFFVYLLVVTQFDNDFSKMNISNSLFPIGMGLFFFGLISTTNASSVFLGVTYSVKGIISRKEREHKTYYEYLMDKGQKRENQYSIPILIIGVIYITASLLIV